MLRKSWVLFLVGAAIAAEAAAAGAFGLVVPIGGAASDVALDEPRGVVYIANFTANRIDILSTATNKIQTSINVAAQPSSLSLSPDGHWLIVTHYGNNTAPASQQNGLTLIDLNNNNAKQTFALGNAPLGVSFGIDNRALVVTTGEFIIFDPTVGSTSTLITIQAAAKQALPAPAQSFPPSITGASVAASADYTVIYGLGDNLEFRYDVGQRALIAYNYISTPPQGPRAVSVAADGSYAASGWTLSDYNLSDVGEFPAPGGILNVGGHAVDSIHGIIYSQVLQKAGEAPTMTIRDADNLTIRQTLLLPENMAGKTAVSHDGSMIYATSDSGILILPVGNLSKTPQLATSTQQMIFLGNFCDRNIATQTFTVTSPGGLRVPFQIAASYQGVTVSPSSGTTPAVITVTVDPSVFQNEKGTATVQLKVTSSTAVNSVPPINIQINSREPSQRGSVVTVPGVLVDLAADPVRNRFYILRTDLNQVLVYDGSNNLQTGTLRTCTAPTSMAISVDGSVLYVACNNAHILSVFALDTLQPMPYINTGAGYVQSVAVSNKAILAVMRDGGGGTPYIARIDPVTRSTSKPGSLGVYQNQVLLTSVLTSSPNGSSILMASSDGSMLLYDANVDTFTISRKDNSGSLSGAYAASSFSQYLVGATLYNASLVPIVQFEKSTGNPSGFVFVDNVGVRTSAPDLNSPGVIQRANLASGAGIRPTSMIEAPLLGLPPSAQINTCNTVTTGNTSVETCIVGTTVTTTNCIIANNASGVPTQTCSSLTTTANPQPGFSRTLALLQNRTNFISLTASGFTVLPVTYDVAVAAPTISSVVSAADGKSPAAPGGLISLFGTNLSPTNLATSQIPVPTALANSCLTVNGQPLPLIFVSPNQINAQMPFQAVGNVTMIVHTPGGVSDNFNLTVLTNAPAVFLSGAAGPVTNLPTIVRADNNQLATDSNPVHHGDTLVIYLTGMGSVTPVVSNGMPAPSNPLATALVAPTVQLGGVSLPVYFAGLAPGQVGVYQINVSVPSNVPQGLTVPLNISQGGFSNVFSLRVVD